MVGLFGIPVTASSKAGTVWQGGQKTTEVGGQWGVAVGLSGGHTLEYHDPYYEIYP